MMAAMATYDPVLISLFVASWTVGMAAMMFPAVSPMVLLYNKLISGSEGSDSTQSLSVQDQPRSRPYPLKTILFVGSYLLVWAITGLVLFLGWSLVMNNVIMSDTADNMQQQQQQLACSNGGIYMGSDVSLGGSIFLYNVDSSMPITFSMLLTLVSSSNAENAETLWGFIGRYRPGVTPQTLYFATSDPAYLDKTNATAIHAAAVKGARHKIQGTIRLGLVL